MARLDIRCDLNLPVEILLNSGSMAHHRGNAINIGLGGAFISADRLVPEDSVVELKAQIPDYGSLQTKGKVLRKQAEGFALKFLNLDTATKANLWDYISGNLYEPVDYPDNGGSSSDVSPMVLPMHRAEEISFRLKILEKAVDGFNRKLLDIDLSYDDENPDAFLREVAASLHEVFDVCRGFERAVGENSELVRRTQVEFRQKTDPVFSKSNLINHARTWPKGYPGDYKLIESIYRNTPLSEGLGYLLDKYFLSTTLAVAVKHRKDKMRNLLQKELGQRRGARILNIGCGSCREIFELASDIESSGARVICLDFDSDALNFAAGRLSYTDVLDRINLRKYNVLRLVSSERNAKEFGQQDVIYSIGLLDYLADDVLVRLIRALYDLLNPGGKFFAAFKDSERYDTRDYHWPVDWAAFCQRTSDDSRSLIANAGVPSDAVSVERDSSGVIIFYTITKK